MSGRIPIDRLSLRAAVRSGVAAAMAEYRASRQWAELAQRVERHDAHLATVAYRGVAEDAEWVESQLRKRQAWLAEAARRLGISPDEAVRRFGWRRFTP